MPTEQAAVSADGSPDDGARTPTPAAQRALAEAEERRQLATTQAAKEPKAVEIGGRQGPDPTRYGDWENRGIASDF